MIHLVTHERVVIFSAVPFIKIFVTVFWKIHFVVLLIFLVPLVVSFEMGLVVILLAGQLPLGVVSALRHVWLCDEMLKRKKIRRIRCGPHQKIWTVVMNKNRGTQELHKIARYLLLSGKIDYKKINKDYVKAVLDQLRIAQYNVPTNGTKYGSFQLRIIELDKKSKKCVSFELYYSANPKTQNPKKIEFNEKNQRDYLLDAAIKKRQYQIFQIYTKTELKQSVSFIWNHITHLLEFKNMTEIVNPNTRQKENIGVNIINDLEKSIQETWKELLYGNESRKLVRWAMPFMYIPQDIQTGGGIASWFMHEIERRQNKNGFIHMLIFINLSIKLHLSLTLDSIIKRVEKTGELFFDEVKDDMKKMMAKNMRKPDQILDKIDVTLPSARPYFYFKVVRHIIFPKNRKATTHPLLLIKEMQKRYEKA